MTSTQENLPHNAAHTLMLGSLHSWLQLLKRSQTLSRPYWGRAITVTLFTSLTIPLKLYEQFMYGQAIKQTPIHPMPIFILGHWRSGTTYLHNLLSHDPQFGFMTSLQGLIHGFFLTGDRHFKNAFRRSMPKTRLIDNMAFDIDFPQEEDLTVATQCPYSIMHMFSFPQQFEQILPYMLMKEVPAKEKQAWEATYRQILQKATYHSGGKPLLIKSPANTGRIQLLLELFPQAKFVHLHRHPYELFMSSRKFYRNATRLSQLQQFDEEKLDERIILVYQKLMKQYLAERAQIPAGNLVEISYADLAQNPLPTLRHIYTQLNLTGYEQAEATFQAHVQSRAHFTPTPYQIEPVVREQLHQVWAFAFDEWHYHQELI